MHADHLQGACRALRTDEVHARGCFNVVESQFDLPTARIHKENLFGGIVRPSATLRGITWDHPRGYDCLCAADKACPPTLPVRVSWDKRSLKDFGDAPLAELARDYDLLIIDHPPAGEAAASGAVLPLHSLLPADALSDLAHHSAGASPTTDPVSFFSNAFPHTSMLSRA